jgi:hypothetical protein
MIRGRSWKEILKGKTGDFSSMISYKIPLLEEEKDMLVLT